MSGVAIVRYKLANAAPVTTAVPAAKIIAGVLPINTVLPAIGITQISGNDNLNVAMTGNRLVTERVQVTVMAPTYALQKSILQLIRSALPLSRGTVNGFNCDSILPDTEGPDIGMENPTIFMQSQDFMVRFTR